jgi:hypothetical protein
MNGGATGPMNGAGDRVGGRTTGATGGADERDGAGDGDVCLLCGGRGALVAAGEGGRDVDVGVGEAVGLACLFGCFAGAGLVLAVGPALAVRLAVRVGLGVGLGDPLGAGEGRFVSGAAAAEVSTASVADPASTISTSARTRAAGIRARPMPLRSTSASPLWLAHGQQ